MNGPQHYAEAERLLSEAAVYDATTDQTTTDLVKLTASQVHATLALAAATAYPAVRDWCGDETHEGNDWTAVTRRTAVTP